MSRLFKAILFLLVVGAVALVGYAYLGDLTPETGARSVPFVLEDGRLVPAEPAETAPAEDDGGEGEAEPTADE